MTRKDFMRIGFLFNAPVEPETRTEGVQIRLDYEGLEYTDAEMTDTYGTEWRTKYINACMAAGIEPISRKDMKCTE